MMKRKNIFGICAFAAFILAMQEWSLSGISVRTWIVYIITAIGGLLWIDKWKKNKKRNKDKRTWEELDFLLGICLVWNILQIVIDCVNMTGCNENNIFTIVLIMLFFLASVEKMYQIYIDISLVCAFILYAGLLWHFMLDAAYAFNLQPLIKDEQALASFLLLINVIATGEYCSAKDKVKQKFYFIIALAGYFLLFINRNVIGIVLMGICFILFLLIYEPQREFVKRIMQMAFVFFFMLSNMSLFVNYTKLINVECQYSLENSVYLDLVIALAGVFFFSYWDKLPEDEEKLLYDFQNAIKWILAGMSIILFLLLTMGNRLDGMAEAKGISVLQQLSTELRRYATGHNGTFYDVLGRYGIAGGVWLVCMIIVAMKKMQRQIWRKRVNPILIIVFVMYLMQSVFFSRQSVTAPIYTMLMAAALYGSDRDFPDSGNTVKKLKRSSSKKNGVKMVSGRKAWER